MGLDALWAPVSGRLARGLGRRCNDSEGDGVARGGVEGSERRRAFGVDAGCAGDQHAAVSRPDASRGGASGGQLGPVDGGGGVGKPGLCAEGGAEGVERSGGAKEHGVEAHAEFGAESAAGGDEGTGIRMGN